MSDDQAALETMAKVMLDIRREKQEKDAMKAVNGAHMTSIFNLNCQTPAQVFFTSLALNLNPVPNWDIETASTDGTSLFFNPEFILSLTPDEVHGVVCGHEPMHCGFEHFSRSTGFSDMDLANIAGDLEDNQVCLDAGFVLPASAVLPGRGDYKDLPPGKCFEEYYSILYSKKEDDPQAFDGQGDDPGKCGGFQQSPDPATAAAQSSKWQGQMAAASQAASRAKGDIPGSLQDIIDRILKPKVDPWEVLRDFMTRIAKTEQSWARLNRRHLARGLYLPGKHGYELGDVVLLADISGSMDAKQCQLTAGFLQGVLELFPGRLTIAYHDTEVQDVVDWTCNDGELEIPVRQGNGGTCHRWLNNWLDGLDFEPAIVLACTDMWTDFPSDPDIPFVWLATEENNVTPPFGKLICIAEAA